MKRILITASDMEIGGAERALLGLLAVMDKQKYQIDLFLLRHTGPLMPFIPPDIHLLPENPKYADLGVPIQKVLKSGHLDMVYGRLKGKVKTRQFICKHHLKKENSVAIHYSFRYTMPYLPEISTVLYDLAIAFTIPYYLVEQKTHARKKAAWIHTDYTMLDGDRAEELKVWQIYDHIVSISEAVTQSFLKIYPELTDKVILIENIVLPELIRLQAELPCGTDKSCDEDKLSDDEGVIRLLSIGRLTKAKNFDNIPDICARLIESGCNVKWNIIGFGNEEALIREKIREAGMQKHVFLLGKKSNPYPYIKNCDIYVQPSRYEGQSVAVREAQIIGKPVVITRFPTADNQLKDGINGIIVSMDNEGCANGILELIRTPEKQKQLIRECQMEDFSNKKAALKIDLLL